MSHAFYWGGELGQAMPCLADALQSFPATIFNRNDK
jgi:hypothetical protein